MAMDPLSPWASVQLPPEWGQPQPQIADPFAAATAIPPTTVPLQADPAVPPVAPPPFAAPPPVEEVPVSAQRLTPEEEAQIEIDPLVPPMPDLGEMPEDFVGKPDAISGGALPPQIAAEEAAAAAQGGPVAGQTAGVPEMPIDYISDEDLGAIEAAALNPVEAEILRVKREQAKQDFMATRQLEEAAALRKATEQRFKMEADARAKADQDLADTQAEAKKLAETDITDDAWMESRSPMQKVAAFAAAILGGLTQQINGGRNVGLEAIQQTIAQHTANLRANLANKRQLLGERRDDIRGQYERDMEAAKAAHAQGQAIYEAAIRGLEVESMKFDPRGTTAQRVADGIRQMRATQAAENAKFQQQQFENGLKFAEFGLKQDEFLAKQAAAQAKAAAGAGAGGVKQSPEFWEAYGGIRPPMAMTQKEYDHWLATKGKVKGLAGNDAKSRKDEAEATKAEAEAKAAGTGFQIASPETGDPLVNKDGEPFAVMDATERTRLRGITTAAANIRRLADKIEEVRRKTGGGSKLLGSEDAQELESLAKAIDFETYKAFDLGAPSSGDQEMAQGIKGGVDITSFLKDPKKGLQTYADSVEKKALSHLRGAGYTGPALRFRRNSDLKKAEPSPVEEIAGRLTKNELGRTLETQVQQVGQDVAGKLGVDAPKSEEERNTENDVFALSALAENATDAKTQQEARAALAALANGAVSPIVRAKAAEALKALPGGNERTGAAR